MKPSSIRSIWMIRSSAAGARILLPDRAHSGSRTLPSSPSSRAVRGRRGRSLRARSRASRHGPCSSPGACRAPRRREDLPDDDPVGGRMRRLLRTRSRMGTSFSPRCWRAAIRAAACGAGAAGARPSPRSSGSGRCRGIAPERAFSRVVLPAPVPPEIEYVEARLDAALSEELLIVSIVSVPSLIMSWKRSRWRRTCGSSTSGPVGESGGMIALIRLPSAEAWRPSSPRTRRRGGRPARRSCSGSAAGARSIVELDARLVELALAFDPDVEGLPLTMISLTVSSASSPFERTVDPRMSSVRSDVSWSRSGAREACTPAVRDAAGCRLFDALTQRVLIDADGN